jgi:hypothetical protein
MFNKYNCVVSINSPKQGTQLGTIDISYKELIDISAAYI